MLSGGNCGKGAIAAAVSDVAGGFVGSNSNPLSGKSLGDWGDVIQAAEVGLVGGGTAALSGGSFRDGFTTGAAGYLFNRDQHLKAEDAQVARDGVVKALSLINPGQDERNNIVPLDGNNAQVLDASRIDVSGWSEDTSLHARAISAPVPGFPDLAVKIYFDDTERSNLITIGLVHTGVEHTIDWLFGYNSFDHSNHVNATTARSFCAQVQGGCP